MDRSGWSISLSSDGTVVAIGAYQNDGNGQCAGHARVFAWDDTSSAWVQRGSDIDGDASGDQAGWSVSLSNDGDIIAVGGPGNDIPYSNSGHVRVFIWDGSSSAWVQRGSDIDGELGAELSGVSVSLSGDGNTVSIGAPGNLSYSGLARVFTWDESSSGWVKRGTDIDREAIGDYSGCSVSLSDDGNIIAVGAEFNDGNGDRSGHVRVFTWDGSSSAWVQRGSDIDGEAAGDQSGNSVSLSNDGNTLAIGAEYNSPSGHARVFTWDGSSSEWIQLGSDIDGEASGDSSGVSVSLSGDGTTVAVGARGNDGNGSNSGHVRIFTK